jgi:hypothetical protein
MTFPISGCDFSAILPFQRKLDTTISGGYHGNSQRAKFIAIE